MCLRVEELRSLRWHVWSELLRRMYCWQRGPREGKDLLCVERWGLRASLGAALWAGGIESELGGWRAAELTELPRRRGFQKKAGGKGREAENSLVQPQELSTWLEHGRGRRWGEGGGPTQEWPHTPQHSVRGHREEPGSAAPELLTKEGRLRESSVQIPQCRGVSIIISSGFQGDPNRPWLVVLMWVQESQEPGTAEPSRDKGKSLCRCSVTESCLTAPHGQQHARPPCPSLSPGACSDSCP